MAALGKLALSLSPSLGGEIVSGQQEGSPLVKNEITLGRSRRIGNSYSSLWEREVEKCVSVIHADVSGFEAS